MSKTSQVFNAVRVQKGGTITVGLYKGRGAAFTTVAEQAGWQVTSGEQRLFYSNAEFGRTFQKGTGGAYTLKPGHSI
jgi:hypothetical protein